MSRKKAKSVFTFICLLAFVCGFTQAVKAQTHTFSLKQGENLISLPLTPQDTAIEAVLAPVISRIKDVWTYDPADNTNPWKHFRPGLSAYSSLTRMDTDKGYWIDVKYDATLQISGTPVSDNAVLDLKQGWNLIGWPYAQAQPITEALQGLTFGLDFTKVTTFDNTAKAILNFTNQPADDDFNSFTPGQGYYIYMLRDKTIAIGIPTPDIPANITVTTTQGSVTLNWDAATTSSLAGYNVYRSEQIGGDCTKLNSALITNNSFTDATAQEAMQYYYRITAVDSYGNESSHSVIVYRYSGTTIGPTGGEVVSADGRVRVIIPPQALDNPTEITILSPLEQYLTGAVPEGQAILCAAEFKPYNLQFLKLVQVIYTLPKAEVPGTGVELGLYNFQTDEITPTGQNSVVATDGYTVTFTIDHFSTYAALKGLFSQGAPIGSGVDIPLPDMFTGAFGHSIPLTIPPGRKNMQPNLSLSYRSSNPNSWLGVGFALNPGYIVRSTRLGPPSYNDTQDSFYFINSAGSTELVHLTDNLYQAKIETAFTKFFKEGDTWRVMEKNGMTLYLGQTTESKETTDQGTFSWQVTKAVDTNGNFVEYNYTKDSGKAYLDYIDYTGNENVSISCPNRIEFYLESRDDIASSFISGAEMATAKRLDEIQVKQNGNLVWRYDLEYEYSPDTNRSLLKAVTQYGADGAALPTQRFRYQSVSD